MQFGLRQFDLWRLSAVSPKLGILGVLLCAIFALSACTEKEKEALEEALLNPSPGKSNEKNGAGFSGIESLETEDANFNRHIYPTGGIHNDKGCGESPCLFLRPAQAPEDPIFPDWWTTEWTMYRVHSNYQNNPPPYTSPPERLKSDDFESSTGKSWYDSTYVPRHHDGTRSNFGAFMQHFEKKCLPLFKGSNDYSCSFVSLGNKTYLIRYDDRPDETPKCCLFSPMNHPPRLDFVKHLEYDIRRSQMLGGTVDVYTRLFGKKAESLLGYVFEKESRPDSFDERAEPYRHPHSMFFTGSTAKPVPDAPIVSINYNNFRMEKPAPSETWDIVGKTCPKKPEWCCLYGSDCNKIPASRRSSRPAKAAE
ncbi:Uncharacterised protein [BD1-7 clade bacterium]|uniref:Uncharacterized protein n=1 Tax=BD1-7 clade bacterium TaxID=2029982 RepID=A0A5S9QE21_9GAMM|nr:Uncharacterised protein [BD1-7 clade bacterium]CAA0115826.1 Uncharacterised protein [BD1-7 clade bacterium]